MVILQAVKAKYLRASNFMLDTGDIVNINWSSLQFILHKNTWYFILTCNGWVHKVVKVPDSEIPQDL